MPPAGYLGTSQNGWPVYDDAHFKDHAVYTKVEGVGFWSANADVALVMDDFTQKYHDRIEHITLPVAEWPGYDDWSRALRPVRGQTTGYSNHGSCTARDLNSTRHPRGVHGTYTDLKRKGLRELVNDSLYLVDGASVLRDGEFYQTGTIDGMHVEANKGPAAFKIVADRIRAKAHEEDDMKLTDEIDLGPTSAAAYGVPKGSHRTVAETLLYPAGVERLRKELALRDKAFTAQLTAQQKTLDAMAKGMQALATGSASDVKAAFETGMAGIHAELDELTAAVEAQAVAAAADDAS